MNRLFKNRKKFLFVAGDIAAVFLANLLAVVLRFDFVWLNMILPGWTHCAWRVK